MEMLWNSTPPINYLTHMEKNYWNEMPVSTALNPQQLLLVLSGLIHIVVCKIQYFLHTFFKLLILQTQGYESFLHFQIWESEYLIDTIKAGQNMGTKMLAWYTTNTQSLHETCTGKSNVRGWGGVLQILWLKILHFCIWLR